MYGLDNHIWGTVGYSRFRGKIGDKSLRLRPGGLPVQARWLAASSRSPASTNNTWGLGMSETFDVFGSTANNDPSFYVAIPNRYFEGVEGLPMPPGGGRGVGAGYQSAAQFYNAHYVTPYIRQVDVFGGYTAGAGHQLYTARAFPKPYWNRIAFINEPTAHLVGQGIIEKRGAGFVTRDGWNLLAGAEEWVAPVQAQVGPDGAVWVSDWYNFIGQHNPTPQNFSNGAGNAYETSMRDESRGRIYRVVYRGAPPQKKLSLSKSNAAGLVAALSSDNMLWRLHAQRLLVERGQKDVVPQLLALVRNTSVDEIGLNGAALHALWTLHGLGELSSLTSEAGKAAVDALKHPAGGRAEGGGDGAAEDRRRRERDRRGGPARGQGSAHPAGRDPRDRRCAGVARARPAALQGERQRRQLQRSLAEPRDVHRRDPPQGARSSPSTRPTRRPCRPARCRSRCASARPSPTGARPTSAALSADWKEMQAPGQLGDARSRGLRRRGVVHADGRREGARRRGGTVDRPGRQQRRSLGQRLVGVPLAPGGGRRRGTAGRRWARQRAAVVRVAAGHAEERAPIRSRCASPTTGTTAGSSARRSRCSCRPGRAAMPLAGAWRYRVERQTNAGALYAKPGELAAHVALASAPASATGTLPETVVRAAPDVVIRLSVTPGEMKFDKTELNVAPGQLVEIVFTNPDTMQHNFVLGQQNSLNAIGTAADELARTPNGPAQQYVPQIPQVLFFTKLVEPGETVTVQFKAPAEAGQYPYVCTFPGHWRIMNGILNVRAPQGRGRGGVWASAEERAIRRLRKRRAPRREVV